MFSFNFPFMLAKLFIQGDPPSKVNKSMPPPVGWIMSEKFDGYRAQWVQLDGEWVFISRNGKKFSDPPDWFKLCMPGRNLDGELWIGRENFQGMGVVRKKVTDPNEWKDVKFVVYDIPDSDKPFSERLKQLKRIVHSKKQQWLKKMESLPEPFNTVECPLFFEVQTVVESEDHLEKVYQSVIQKGGEGIMIKRPDSLYVDKRADTMLKVKPAFDEECIILDYKEGKGKYEGLLGGFLCKPLINMGKYQVIDTEESHEFYLSGMDDEIRNDYLETHPPGTVITYEHSGKTDKNGKPRFARYLRKRDDVVIKDSVEANTVNRDLIISIFKVIANNEKVNGNGFKSASYIKAINYLKSVNDDSEITKAKMKDVRGIGDSICEKIDAIIKTGTCPQFEKLKGVDDPRATFMNIHGVGPKKAKLLVDDGITTIKQLRQVMDDNLNDVQKLGLKYYESFLQPIPREEIKKHEKVLIKILKEVDDTAQLTIAGSYRRGKPESGDIDVLITSSKKATYNDFIKELNKRTYLIDTLAHGNKKYNGVSKIGVKGVPRRIDIMYTKPSEYPFAIFYFTGSDNFNKMVRKELEENGKTINEYSIKEVDPVTKKKTIIDHVFKTEEDIFDFIGMDYVEPKDRK